MLFHVSEEAGIRRFDPRPSQSLAYDAVWAIDEDHIRNYLLPRDCPRVTFYALPASTEDDIRRYLGTDRSVIAFERRWLDRVQSCTLYRYHLPSEAFHCVDEGAGYFVSTQPVVPSAVDVIDDPLTAIAEMGGAVRVLDDLWHLHDSIARSSLRFSMIRMRNALPRKS